MAVVKPIIFQVVGFQNSGKTTIITQLIKELKAEGLQVASIKHHGHGGKPSVAENKDTSRHLEAGAIASLVEGEGRLLLQVEKSFTIEEKIQLLRLVSPDIVFIEGYKKKDFPKLVLIREKRDIELLPSLKNVKAVMVWDQQLTESVKRLTDLPCFSMKEISMLIHWTKAYLMKSL